MHIVGVCLDLLCINGSIMAEVEFLDDSQRGLQQASEHVLALEGSRKVGEGNDL